MNSDNNYYYYVITNIVNGTNNFNDTSNAVTRCPFSSMGGCSVDV